MTSPVTGPAICFEGLTKQFGDLVAVRDLTFTVQPGRVTGFIGPNGAGKTTTLRMLLGLTAPTDGRATFGGTAYVDLPQPQCVVGAVLEPNFHPGRTGRNHLRVQAVTAGADEARVEELLRVVGLEAAGSRPVRAYSLGMRQRLALAGALLGDPDCLVLDEPANGLDPEGVRWLRTFLRFFAGTGRTVLVSSHMLNEVEATVDDVVVVGHGRLLSHTSIAEIDVAEGCSRLRVSDADGAEQALDDLGVGHERALDAEGVWLRVWSVDTVRIGSSLFASGIAVYELTRERRMLEDRFFALLEDSA